jgi:hypothetical protein
MFEQFKLHGLLLRKAEATFSIGVGGSRDGARAFTVEQA